MQWFFTRTPLPKLPGSPGAFWSRVGSRWSGNLYSAYQNLIMFPGSYEPRLSFTPHLGLKFGHSTVWVKFQTQGPTHIGDEILYLQILGTNNWIFDGLEVPQEFFFLGWAWLRKVANCRCQTRDHLRASGWGGLGARDRSSSEEGAGVGAFSYRSWVEPQDLFVSFGEREGIGKVCMDSMDYHHFPSFSHIFPMKMLIWGVPAWTQMMCSGMFWWKSDRW